jgi:hypothetical protein
MSNQTKTGAVPEKTEYVPEDWDQVHKGILSTVRLAEVMCEEKDLQVWTVVRMEDKLYAIDGFHWHNKVGYLYTRKKTRDAMTLDYPLKVSKEYVVIARNTFEPILIKTENEAQVYDTEEEARVALSELMTCVWSEYGEGHLDLDEIYSPEDIAICRRIKTKENRVLYYDTEDGELLNPSSKKKKKHKPGKKPQKKQAGHSR